MAQPRPETRAALAGRTVAMVGLLVTLAAGCGPQPAEERGRELASDPRLSPSPSNVFACTTCHSVSTSPESRIYPGHPLPGALTRPSFWGGEVRYVLDAVNQCFVDFMRGTPLAADDPSGRALLAYLRTLTPAAAGPDAARPCTVVRNIDPTYLAQLPTGEPARGADTYQRACAYCHGAAHTGQGLIINEVIDPSIVHRAAPPCAPSPEIRVPGMRRETYRPNRYPAFRENGKPFLRFAGNQVRLSILVQKYPTAFDSKRGKMRGGGPHCGIRRFF